MKKAKKKNDQKAIKFSEWYLTKYNQEHKNSYPNFIKKLVILKINHKNYLKLKS
jgi:hypothetical protein